MVSVSEMAASSVAENHGETAVNRHSLVLRDREKSERSKADEHLAMQRFVIGPRPASPVAADFNFARMRYVAPVGGWAKRASDITIASTTLFLMAPIMLVIALLIYITMGRPIFFLQRRVGFNQEPFRCFKFRTMVRDANEKLVTHLARCPDSARSWAESQKLRHDPRITWLGQVLRKSSLDELPQLFNILRGEMSCIGPRPVIEEELRRYGKHAADYARAKPGLTGMWQVNGRSTTTYEHRVKCDRYYVRRWSMLLDLKILFKTVPAVLKVDETS
jgi:exopolysaccharide production protein ExoY